MEFWSILPKAGFIPNVFSQVEFSRLGRPVKLSTPDSVIHPFVDLAL